MPHSVRCPDCFGTEYSYEFQDLEVKYGKNLFDLSRVKTHPPLPTATWISSVNVEEHSFVISPPTNGFAESGYRTIGVLSDLTSFLEPDTSYVITFSIESGYNFVYLVGSGRMWYSGQALILTEADLSEQITFYGNRDTDCRVEFIQIEKGSVATAYEPFDAEYIELVPPLYHFTCSSSDCGTVWTEEAEFQGASVTFSCTRCGAEKIEVEEKPIEEEGWFDWIGKQFRTLISAIVNGFASGLEFLLSEVIVTTVSWLINIVEWVFGLFDSASLTEWFNWFDDSNPAFSEWSEQTVWGS